MEKEERIKVVSFIIQTLVLGSLYIYGMILIWYTIPIPSSLLKVLFTLLLIANIIMIIKIIDKIQSKVISHDKRKR